MSLRLRGDYLAMVTLAFAEIVRNLAISLDRPINLTGGQRHPGPRHPHDAGFQSCELARTTT